MQDYKPISCSLYDVLEVAAMKKRRLSITVSGTTREIDIEDVFAKGHEEFLKGRDVNSREMLRIRLDTIELIVDPAEKKSYVSNHC